VIVGLACVAVSCVPAYKPPTADEPHAILKLRRTYEKSAGTQLTEVVKIGDNVAYQAVTDSRLAESPKTDALLIHPVAIDLVFEMQFSHQYTHMVQEHYSQQVPYQTTESYNCGTPPRYQTCTRPATRYRYEQKTRWVNRTETKIDGRCESALHLNPKQGSSYLMQFTYQDHAACSLSCFEQIAAADGSMQQTACP
jgi:hypothetical protein